MMQNPCKTLGFKKNMVYKIPPGGEVNHIKPVAYTERFFIVTLTYWFALFQIFPFPYSKPSHRSITIELNYSDDSAPRSLNRELQYWLVYRCL